MYSTRIFYQDTDAGGVVYYANYLRFFEKSWYAWLSSIGVPLERWEEQDTFVMVKMAHVDLIDKVRLGETVTVATTVKEVGRASFMLLHAIHCGGRLTTKGHTQMVCVNGQGRPKGLPSAFREALLNHVNRERVGS
jgi:acyl-CoA thioester hydrolase